MSFIHFGPHVTLFHCLLEGNHKTAFQLNTNSYMFTPCNGQMKQQTVRHTKEVSFHNNIFQYNITMDVQCVHNLWRAPVFEIVHK